MKHPIFRSSGIPILMTAFVMNAHPTIQAADWPQWRGIHRNGRSPETSLLKSWPEGGPKLLWTARELGSGFTAPSIFEGKVYGMGYRGDEEIAWALDAASGKEIWSVRTAPANRDFGYADGPRCTPTVDGDRLYTLGGGGNVTALDRITGKVLWTKDLVGEFGGKLMSDWGFSESVLIDGDRLVCTPGGEHGTMLALNKLTGEKIWQTAEITDNAAFCSIMVATFGGTRQYVQLTDSHVFGIDPENGKLLWKTIRSANMAVIPTPVIEGDVVYVTSGYGFGCSAFKISGDGGRFNATNIYSNKVMKNHHGGVVLVGDYLYGYSDGGGWTCQNFKTGEAVWRERKKFGKGSITYADGRLYCRHESEEGTMVMLEATPDGYREYGRFDQPERSGANSWPHPIISGGRLYLRDQEVLLCYDIKSRTEEGTE